MHPQQPMRLTRPQCLCSVAHLCITASQSTSDGGSSGSSPSSTIPPQGPPTSPRSRLTSKHHHSQQIIITLGIANLGAWEVWGRAHIMALAAGGTPERSLAAAAAHA